MNTEFVDARWGVNNLGGGTPDFQHDKMAIWLIVRGPPFAMRFVRYPPSNTPEEFDFYHRHDTVDSIHVLTAGSGFYLVDGKEYSLTGGMVVHHARGVPHCGPFPGRDGMDMLVIQTPHSGHISDFIVCPDAGLRGAFGDRAAFDAKYGDRDYSRFGKLVFDDKAKMSEKWIEWHRTS